MHKIGDMILYGASGVMTVAADEDSRHARSVITGRRIYVDDATKSDFLSATDYNDFRKKAFAARLA